MRLFPFDYSILSWLKATLNPNDAAEIQATREKLEIASTNSVRRELQWVQSELFAQEPKNVVQTTTELTNLFQSQRVRDVLARMLLNSSDLGVFLATSQFEGLGLSFDWTLAHANARAWALQYTDTLLHQLGTTNLNVVGQAVGNWISNGEPLRELIRDLEVVFGTARAERIAITESTRAFAEGTLQGYALAGYGEQRPTERIPKHVRCRCGYGLQFNKDGSADFIFLTAVDERVCPICNPLNGQVVGRAKSATPGLF